MTADSRWMGRGWMSERGGVPADARRAGDAPSFAVFTSESTGLETTTAYNDVAGQKRKKKQKKTDRQTDRHHALFERAGGNTTSVLRGLLATKNKKQD